MSWRRILCALTWHTWRPLIADAGHVLHECSFCLTHRWLPRFR